MVRRFSLFVLPTASLVALLAYGCSDDEKANTPSADGGGLEASSLDRKVPPTDSASPGDGGGTTCEPQDMKSFKPSWKEPTALHQGRCTAAQAATFADCAYGHAGYDQAKCTAFQAEQANADCIACAAPPVTGVKLGPALSTQTSTNVNYAGCVALLTGDVTAQGCGAKIQAAEDCRVAACKDVCPVVDGDEEQFAAYSKCLEDAWTGACLDYSSQTSCADDFRDGNGVAGVCYPNTTNFGVILETYVTLFCGAASDGGTEGGADASADAPGDGSNG